MLRFFSGIFIGFVLGTTYPEETKSLVKLAISKTMHILQNVESDLNKNKPKKHKDYDEDYAPLFENHNSGYSDSSF